MPCRCACASGSPGVRFTAAGAAPRRSCRLRRRTVPFPAACRPRGCWPRWRWRNTTTDCRCTARPRSWSATASISTAPPCRTGWAWWLKPLWELLLTSILSSPKLFCDDTRLPVLAPGKGKTSTGYLWGLARDDSPWQGDLPPAYVYTEDRVRAREVLAGYTGVLQGWGGFKRLTGKQDAVPDDAGSVTLAFCWSHGRRQFFEIHQSSQSPIAGEVLRRIAELYRIEDAIRGQPPDARQAVRQDSSRA